MQGPKFQKFLKREMRRRAWRVSDLAEYLDRSYTTVREWVVVGRWPNADTREKVAALLTEKKTYPTDCVFDGESG